MKQNRLKQLFYDNCDEKNNNNKRKGRKKTRQKKAHLALSSVDNTSHFSPWGLRFSPKGLCFSPWGLRFSPRGLCFSPWGLRFSPRGLCFSLRGLRLVHGVLGLRFRNTLSELALPVSKLTYAT